MVVWSAVAESGGGSAGDYSAAQLPDTYCADAVENVSTRDHVRIRLPHPGRPAIARAAQPVHPIHADIAENVSAKAITMPFMLGVGALLALIFRPSSPSLWALAAAIPALFLLPPEVPVEWTLAQAAFWTTRVSAIIRATCADALPFRQVAPLGLFHRAQTLAAILPFRWISASG